jgi:hypothetical protein
MMSTESTFLTALFEVETPAEKLGTEAAVPHLPTG